MIPLHAIHNQWFLDDDDEQTVLSIEELTPKKIFLSKVHDQLSLELYRQGAHPENLMARITQVLKDTRTVVTNPSRVLQNRGRPQGSKNRSTARDKSEFEYVSGRKCGSCGGARHNSRTCTQKNESVCTDFLGANKSSSGLSQVWH